MDVFTALALKQVLLEVITKREESTALDGQD